MNDENVKKQIRKIIELADRGCGGEKNNAQTMLDKLLKKYNLSINDFVDDVMKDYKLTVYTKHEHQLLINIIAKILNVNKVVSTLYKRKCYFTVNKVEFAQIDYLYKIYRKALKKELKKQSEAVFGAFIHKNNIFPDIENEDKKSSSVSQEELRRMVDVMDGMKSIIVNNLIEG